MNADEQLAELLRHLKVAGYRFTTVTPATHAAVLARPAPANIGLRDIFGWNRWFAAADLHPRLLRLLQSADALEVANGELRSKVRVASLGSQLFLHSAFPTDGDDAVFFGPDTYRFARFVEQRLAELPDRGWLLDMGAGCGGGGITAARSRPFSRLTLVDVNDAALRLAQINASAAGIAIDTVSGSSVPAGANVVIANPPYMMDPAARTYRDGGDLHGGAIALDWVTQALAALAPGGTMLLYTGAAYIAGEAPLITELERVCADAGASLELDEIDPDVFGEELDQPSYSDVERIAAVGAVITTA